MVPLGVGYASDHMELSSVIEDLCDSLAERPQDFVAEADQQTAAIAGLRRALQSPGSTTDSYGPWNKPNEQVAHSEGVGAS